MEHPLDEFENLRRLLALKRHESPPPRFFDELPGQVMRQISAAKPSRWNQWLDQVIYSAWFQPVVATGLAVILGGLFVFSLMTGQPPAPSGNSAQFMNPATAVLAPEAATNQGPSALFPPRPEVSTQNLSLQPAGRP